MFEREQEQQEPATSPPEGTEDATTPPGSGEVDDEAVERGKDQLDQAGGAH